MSLPAHVGVYGGGRMGAGIAHVFLNAGSAVTLIEVTDADVTMAKDRVRRSLANAEQRHALNASQCRGRREVDRNHNPGESRRVLTCHRGGYRSGSSEAVCPGSSAEECAGRRVGYEHELSLD